MSERKSEYGEETELTTSCNYMYITTSYMYMCMQCKEAWGPDSQSITFFTHRADLKFPKLGQVVKKVEFDSRLGLCIRNTRPSYMYYTHSVPTHVSLTTRHIIYIHLYYDI